jgi:hypothetical protein
MKSYVMLIAAVLAGTAAPVSAAAATPTTVTVSEAQNGKTVTVHKGNQVRVLLHSTYWTIAKAQGKALTTSSAQTTKGTGSPCRPAGSGCGTASRRFLAAGIGAGSLTASRTTCGEALRCTGNQGQYKVTIRVVH